MKQGSRIIFFIALVVVLGSVSCFLYYTIRFNVRRTDALNQTQEIADELYPMIVERDFDGMTKYFAKVDGTPATADEVEQYVMSMDEWSFFENYTEEDQPMFHVYGDTNYSFQFTWIPNGKRKGKRQLCWYAWKQKKLRLPDLCKKTKLSKTLRVTTSNYRLFLLVDHSDKIPETI